MTLPREKEISIDSIHNRPSVFGLFAAALHRCAPLYVYQRFATRVTFIFSSLIKRKNGI